jgi:predicted GNAT family acetyltransferase
MATVVCTDHAEIASCLAPLVIADPVRNTVAGTILYALKSSSPGAWMITTPDGADIAVRSSSRTPVVLLGEWADERARGELVAALRALADVVAVNGQADLAPGVAQAVGRVRYEMDQRLFRLDELHPPEGVPGVARQATVEDRGLLVAWWFAFAAEADTLAVDIEEHVDRLIDPGHAWLWDDGEPVSHAARRPVIGGSSRIGPVYTPPEHRGRGYGSAVTAAASADVLSEGAVPVLFTDLANPTSNSIYQRLGYRAVEDFAIRRFC